MLLQDFTVFANIVSLQNNVVNHRSLVESAKPLEK